MGHLFSYESEVCRQSRMGFSHCTPQGALVYSIIDSFAKLSGSQLSIIAHNYFSRTVLFWALFQELSEFYNDLLPVFKKRMK